MPYFYVNTKILNHMVFERSDFEAKRLYETKTFDKKNKNKAEPKNGRLAKQKNGRRPQKKWKTTSKK